MPRHPADHIPTEFGSFNLDSAQPIVPQLYSELRAKILTLQLKPGDAISESELALASGVSRTPARQVIKQLVGENLLVAFSSRGTYVSKIDAARLKDALLIRRLLEPHLARECASARDRDRLVADLRSVLKEQHSALKAGTVDKAYKIDAAFHKTIATCAGGALVWQTLRQARTEADRLHTLSRNRENSLQNALRQHRKIVDAIEAGDAEGSFQAMHHHMETNERAFARTLKEDPQLFSASNAA